jgi:hypothetical protein
MRRRGELPVQESKREEAEVIRARLAFRIESVVVVIVVVVVVVVVVELLMMAVVQTDLVRVARNFVCDGDQPTTNQPRMTN